MVSNLAAQLLPLLNTASEVYIASALINRAGFNFIKSNIPDGCVQSYVVGIDLPTSPDVLQEMFDRQLNSRIFRSNQTYHPKVYLIRCNDGTLHAFVGSSNTTNGGLYTNVEMSIKASDETAEDLMIWYRNLYNTAFIINQQFIDRYRLAHGRIRSRAASTYSDVSNLKKLLGETHANSTSNAPSNTIMAQQQFFSIAHHQAYEEPYWYDYSDAANQNRKEVWKRFKELHEMIYARFNEFGIAGMHCHYHPPSIVSHYTYRQGFTNPKMQGMWLHYGYSASELNGSQFLNHPRMQVILHHNDIGIWLVLGKDGGSSSERELLKSRLDQSEAFRNLFFNNVLNLGSSYWIETGGEYKSVTAFRNATELNEFIQHDDGGDYFIIGRDYSLQDPTLSTDNMAETVLVEFQRLYPVYNSCKATPSASAVI